MDLKDSATRISTNVEIAVKKISHESSQGMKEFVAEIVSMGRLRHRNLVQLLGYCRRKGELLLVYDCMPNGSLDKFLFNNKEANHHHYHLDWPRRYQIIKGIASALLYQCVLFSKFRNPMILLLTLAWRTLSQRMQHCMVAVSSA